MRSGVINFMSQRNFKQTFVSEFLFKKSNACFLWRFEYTRRLNANFCIGSNNRNYDGENNDIFLVGGDALVYLAETMQKNIPKHSFRVIHLVRTYLMADFSAPLPLYALAHNFDDLP